MRRDQIGLQLFTVRERLAMDLDAGLRAVAAAGYRHVELAALAHVPTDRLARALDDAGLRTIAAHEPVARLREDPVGIARRLRALGCDRVFVPAMPEEDRRTPGDVRRFVTELGRLASTLAGEGVRLGHHNHDYEFAPLGGTTPWAILLAELPPEVEVELDVYWASVGGCDPVAAIREAGDRVRLLHLKDRAPGSEPRDIAPGQGVLDIPAIVEAGRAAGVEWYVTELVDAPDPMVAIEAAARYLAGLATPGSGASA